MAKLVAVGAVGLGAVVGVASLLPANHVNKTYAMLQAKAQAKADARAIADNQVWSNTNTNTDGGADDEAAIDFETVSAEQLWKHLDHPDNVLGFVRFHMLKEMNLTEVRECTV